MKILHYILIAAFAVSASGTFTQCGPAVPDWPGQKPVDKPDKPDKPDEPDNSLNGMSLYEAFQTQFDAGCAMNGFLVEGNGRYKVLFSDNRRRDIDEDEVAVVICTPTSWPAVKPENGIWQVDGNSTDIPYADSREDERIVLVMCDSEGLYVRLSSGYMFFFHQGTVPDIGCFRFEKALNPSLREDVICSVSGTEIHGRLNPATTVFDLVATVASRGAIEVHAGGYIDFRSSVTSLDYSQSIALTLKKNGAGGKLFNVVLQAAGRVPVLYINTGSVKKDNIQLDNYIDATMRLYNPDGLYSDQYDENFYIQIHGRGNSTWGMPKKPYKIKLAGKNRLLGMSDSKHWVLMANYSDKTLLRNALAFKLSELAGMQWAVRWRPVEVYFSSTHETNAYAGLYMLAEHVRVDPERIDLDLVGPADNTGADVTGGYLLWIDGKGLGKGYPGFWTAKGVPVVIEEPEVLTSQQRTYIEGFMKKTEQDIYNMSFADYSKIIDIDSFIRYFFVQELAKNVDGDMRLSTYMTKLRDGKLGFPCVWDFDIAFGNCNYNGSGNGPTGWHIRNCFWFNPLFRSAEFAAKVTEAWNEFYPKLAEAEAEMRAIAKVMDDAQKRNFTRWNILNSWEWPNYVVVGSYQGELDYMLDFFMQRAEWMNTEIKAGRHRIN